MAMQIVDGSQHGSSHVQLQHNHAAEAGSLGADTDRQSSRNGAGQHNLSASFAGCRSAVDVLRRLETFPVAQRESATSLSPASDLEVMRENVQHLYCGLRSQEHEERDEQVSPQGGDQPLDQTLRPVCFIYVLLLPHTIGVWNSSVPPTPPFRPDPAGARRSRS